MNTVLEVKGLTKDYKDVRALDNVSFEVQKGEIFGFLGPNGAGKSTALKIICGLAFATSGSVRVLDADVQSNRVKALGYIGAVVETPVFYSRLSAFDNLRLVGAFYDNTDDAVIDGLLELVGLADRKYSKVGAYSLGMKQRLGIAQAIIHKPKLLVLDEPANGLDPVGIVELRSLLKMLAEKYGMAIIVSSHQLHEIQHTADRVAVIKKGKILAVKNVEELLEGEVANRRAAIKVDNIRLATEIAEKLGYTVKIAGIDTIETNIIEDGIATLNRELIMGGVNILSSRVTERNLEDAFIELTANTAEKAEGKADEK